MKEILVSVECIDLNTNFKDVMSERKFLYQIDVIYLMWTIPFIYLSTILTLVYLIKYSSILMFSVFLLSLFGSIYLTFELFYKRFIKVTSDRIYLPPVDFLGKKKSLAFKNVNRVEFSNEGTDHLVIYDKNGGRYVIQSDMMSFNDFKEVKNILKKKLLELSHEN